MICFILVLNRRDKSGFSVGEGILTARLVQLYKPEQVSTFGLLHDSCIVFAKGCCCLQEQSLFCEHRVI